MRAGSARAGRDGVGVARRWFRGARPRGVRAAGVHGPASVRLRCPRRAAGVQRPAQRCRRRADCPPRRRTQQGRPTRRSLLRYDTRCYINVRSKADISQLNLPHGTDN